MHRKGANMPHDLDSLDSVIGQTEHQMSRKFIELLSLSTVSTGIIFFVDI